MTIDDREAILGRGDALWGRLRAAIDEHSLTKAYEAHDWTGHDVYAHFARWQAHARSELTHLLSGEPLSPLEGDENAINDAWIAEDRALPTAVVRDRCLHTRQELRDALMSLTPEQWNRFGRRFSPDINGEHYEAHLADLSVEAP